KDSLVWQFEIAFYTDNVMYLELRALLPLVLQSPAAVAHPWNVSQAVNNVFLFAFVTQTYEWDGSTHDTAWTLKTYQEVTKQFTEDHPGFFAPWRRFFYCFKCVKGSFTLLACVWVQVGREDKGRPLWYFRDALSLPAERGVKLPFFFHAGETGDMHVEGTEVDQNLLDALLFNTSRIGHGFALGRHPLAKELSRKRGVAVEVCPISNQVLKLVNDMRNHPAAALMSENHPLVISSEYPAMFATSGLSYDFYEAFVGFGGVRSNLGSLKELAMNSIRYSSLNSKLQDKALAGWKERWHKFVSENSF
uniref:Adenosine deaminase 2a n=1 Tax=Gasterosteus aculeatus aculeatus TaxID=481459 RepID=A0AAQ4P250_GASAC